MAAGKSPHDPETLTGLAPVVSPHARVLLLGSMPGARSLTEQRYYAHPRNAFWKVAEALFGVPSEAPYEERLAGLRESGVALWDVIGSCRRPGSLDQAIEAGSIVVNDFAGLFRACPGIRRIGFNGAMAERCWHRHVRGSLPEAYAAIECVRLPSTSPAHAALSLHDKIRAWR
ncbi:MAG: DNA-deoxyinosine glycosylase, partial [Wenzhouxiangellaceae bacterium]